MSSVRARVALTVVLLVIVAVIAVVVIWKSNQETATPTLDAPGLQMMTLDPQVIANMTNLPRATALSGADANQMNSLLQLVNQCSDYTSARRDQMDEQIGFIIDPSQLTGDVIMALGTNPRGKLLFAISQVTKIQWQLEKSPANSCLVPIGKIINQLLSANGETPEPAFEGGSS